MLYLKAMITPITSADCNNCNGQNGFNGHNSRNVCNSNNFCNACDVCDDLLGCVDLSERPGLLKCLTLLIFLPCQKWLKI